MRLENWVVWQSLMVWWIALPSFSLPVLLFRINTACVGHGKVLWHSNSYDLLRLLLFAVVSLYVLIVDGLHMLIGWLPISSCALGACWTLYIAGIWQFAGHVWAPGLAPFFMRQLAVGQVAPTNVEPLAIMLGGLLAMIQTWLALTWGMAVS